MTKTALIIGGTGQIGLATAAALAIDGWRVIAASRTGGAPAVDGVESFRLDRDEPGALARAIGPGVDALIDTVAFDEGHARQLLDLQANVGALVVISSASVYRDDAGRTLDEARETGFPHFPVPIGEDQPTVAPGPATYSTRKIALEQALLRGASRPVTILRPCAIHGPGSRHPREWFFVRRIRDGRRVVPLAFSGASRFHTTATTNIAELVRVALEAPATRILNIADPEAPTVSEIGQTIAQVYGHDLEIVPFEGPPQRGVGASPWSTPRPIVVSVARAEATGYRPVTAYENAVGAACRSAEAMAAQGVAFPDYIGGMFDYQAEDDWLRTLTA
jgi:nucleoside-diphosphate-sugar epimerase